MKPLSFLVIFVSVLQMDFCTPPEPIPPPCNWDHKISSYEELAAKQMWTVTWDSIAKVSEVPDSFLLPKTYLTELEKKYCGFRTTYALSKAGNMSDFGFLLSPYDPPNIQPLEAESYVFVDKSSTQVNKKKIPIRVLPKDTAKAYAFNWKLYNGVCLENDTIGNKDCKQKTPPGMVAPGGGVQSISQIAPLSQVYSLEDILGKLDSADIQYDGLVFVCGFMPNGEAGKVPEFDPIELLNDSTSSSTKLAFRFDFIIRAFRFADGEGQKIQTLPIPGTQSGNTNGNLNLDISCPCPKEPACCNGCAPFC
ncbi:MAG: hypothetical protein AAF399_24755 [Bacteroidota bacterium]